MERWKIGVRVRVKGTHWWRQNDVGTITEVHDDGRFTVLFDKPGIGFDGGACLVLGVTDVDIEEER